MNNIIEIEKVRGYIGDDNLIYLNLEDVARGLGFTKIANSGNEVVRWDRVSKYLGDFGIVPTNGNGNIKDTLPRFIRENIFYKLCMKANNEIALSFQDKVADEILPQIRQTGSYNSTPQTYLEALKELVKVVEENEKLKVENVNQKQLINEYEPKVSYYDMVLQSPNLLTITQIAKDYGLSGTALNKKLNELGVQYKQSVTWLLYQKYSKLGYTKSTTFVDENTGFSKLNTKWTQKGRLFIYDMLKSIGILPLIEREDEMEESYE